MKKFRPYLLWASKIIMSLLFLLASTGKLTKNEAEHFIDNRLNRMLRILMERRNSIVKRNEIIDYVWNEVQVSEENLTKGIFDLRKLLKEKEINTIEITTIRNVGYRLVFTEDETELKTRSSGQLFLKTVLYAFGMIAFLIILIRAIRYEN